MTLMGATAAAIAICAASTTAYLLVRSDLRSRVDADLRRALTLFNAGPGEPATIATPAIRVAPTAPVRIATEPGGFDFFIQILTPGADQAGQARQVGVFGGVPQTLTVPQDSRTVAVGAGTAPAFFSNVTIGSTRLRLLTARSSAGGAVQIGRSVREMDATLARLQWMLALVMAGGVALSAGVGVLITRLGMRPVRRVTEAAESVARTRDLGRRLPGEGPDELGRLTASFNTMLGELDGAVQAQRRLVADASHELRTPLTSLRTNIEVLTRVGDLATDDRDRLVADVTGQLNEFSVLVADLVELANDEGAEREPGPMRLDLVVGDVVERARRLHPGIRLDLRATPCEVRGAPDRIARAVANLIDNATKWGPPGQPIDVAVSGGEITVRDRGPGIPAEDLPHVFERFYRSAAARGLPGSGLGLAIVQQVADRHRAHLSVRNAAGGGACFTLRFPAHDS